ncbi:gem-associated protein 2-like [Stegodyphus dumicola]|uniref:gem-associated protein 2-like n=1 Tax=Stegodyphus dumicola TaxID=202533 RepID=UPI0015A8A86C|nr:gem-associated protein 2-like [Stegodyphus dumicola]
MAKYRGDKGILKRAFDLSELPKTVDLNSPPVSGLDYLYRVRLESRKCPKIVVSNIDTAQFLHLQNVKVDFCNGFVAAKPGFAPDPRWQKEVLELFMHSKQRFSKNRVMLKTKFPRPDFPKLSKQEQWCIFCLGPKKHDELYNVLSKTDCEPSAKGKKLRLSESGNEPLLSVVAHLNQRSVIRLLSYHIDWLEDGSFTHDQGVWIYALLVCLEKPLEPDTCALLRSLSRCCTTHRAKLNNPEDTVLKSLNLIISIIANYFDQKDMSDKFTTD